MRRSLRITLIALGGTLLLVLLAGVLFLTFADFSAYRSQVEDAVSEAIGRQLTISGKFEPRLSAAPGLLAEDIRLADVAWSDEATMVHVDRLEITIDLRSLLFGPLRIRDLQIRGARVRLQARPGGEANWQFEIAHAPGTPQPPTDDGPAVVLERLRITDLVLTYRDPDFPDLPDLTLDTLDALPTEDGLLELRIDGRLDRAPLELGGRIGPLERLFEGERLEHDLAGRIGGVEFSSRGSFTDISNLEGLDVRVDVNGTEASTVAEVLGLPRPGAGPLRLSARAAPAAGGVDVDIDLVAGQVAATAKGRVGSLLDPQEVDLEFGLALPDLSVLAPWVDVAELPGDSLTASGHVRHVATESFFDDAKLRLGDHALALDGVLGRPPGLLGTDVTFEVRGPDLAQLDALAGVALPSGRYRAKGHLLRREEGVGVEGFEAGVGDIAIHASGVVGAPPGYARTELAIRASGPDLSALDALTGLELPAEPFHVEGSFARGDDGIALEGVAARLGADALRVSGTIGVGDGAIGTDVEARIEGPDVSSAARLAGLSGLPGDAYEVEGGLRVLGGGYALDALTARVGEMRLKLDGLVVPATGLAGTDLRVEIAGPDLSRVAGPAGLADMPADAYEIAGRCRVLVDGYAVDEANVRLGDVSMSIDGHLGPLPDLEGTDLELELRGPDLSAVRAYGELPPLPATPFALSGRVGVEQEVFRLENAVATLGPHRLAVDGHLGPFPGLAATDVQLELSGPDLAELARLAADFGVPIAMEPPATTYAASGRVTVGEGGYGLRPVRVKVGDAQLRVEGTLGPAPEWIGTDVAVELSGLDASFLGAMADTALPERPFEVRGRMERLTSGFRFHEVTAASGNFSARVHGSLGEPPRFSGTNLDIQVRGPSLARAGALARFPGLPDQPFDIAGHFDGTPESFSLKRFSAQLGKSDLSGGFRVDLRGKPQIHARFSSVRLDLTRWIEAAEQRPETEAPVPDVAPKQQRTGPKKRKRLVIPDDPLEFPSLNSFDADIRWTADTVATRRVSLLDLNVDVTLDGGRLRLDPVSAKGADGGEFSVTFDLEPANDGYRVFAGLTGNSLRLDTADAEDHERWPPIDVSLQLEGSGRSLHAIAGNADGWVTLVLGPGRLENSALDLLAVDVLMEVFSTLNPFSQEAQHTQVQCGVFSATFTDGQVALEPLALQSDKITVAGRGEIALRTEKLDLVWASKPRKGVGLSTSALTNSYLKLGGTMADPALELRPLRAAATTGAAVATMGLSLLASGMLDRMTAEKKVCKTATRKVEQQMAGRQERAAADNQSPSTKRDISSEVRTE